ncbi:uncharacterized protein LOC119982604 [Tripterygium wilfordii]|uniref:uncharacterized protein LOC119982604 n=1 Tax=Tripterygium wilfordii TaxID=458696 RepID=UPI0018F7F790|nr:uncharacterized protein LOC119982604 [Tripterygium wilfordii]
MVKTRASRKRSATLSTSDEAENTRQNANIDDEVESDDCSDSDNDDGIMNVRFNDSDEDNMDDDLFTRYTNEGVEGDQGGQDRSYELNFTSNEDAIFSDAEYASDSLQSYDGSIEEEQGEKRESHPLFKPIKNMDSYKWHIGIRFPCRDSFKDVVATYAIQGGWSLKWIKFDNVRAWVGYVDGCNFLRFCSKLSGVTTWELKTVLTEHSCERTNGNKMLNSKWLANRLVDKMRRNPKMKLVEIMQKVRDKYTIDISKTVASRARKRALEVVYGSYSEQYKRLNDFCAEILRSNPGST